MVCRRTTKITSTYQLAAVVVDLIECSGSNTYGERIPLSVAKQTLNPRRHCLVACGEVLGDALGHGTLIQCTTSVPDPSTHVDVVLRFAIRVSPEEDYLRPRDS